MEGWSAVGGCQPSATELFRLLPLASEMVYRSTSRDVYTITACLITQSLQGTPTSSRSAFLDAIPFSVVSK